MRRRLFLALLCLAAAAPAQPRAGLPPARIQAIEQAIAQEMEKQKIPGLAVAVGSDYRLAWARGFGLADVEHNVAVKPATVFRLGSISKPFTAVAAMQLVERGRLDLDAPIQKYVPSFPEKPAPITARLLLGHLSGIRHYRAGEMGSTRHYTDLIEPLKVFAGDPLLFEPGARYSYTTYGYCLLGAVVEATSGAKFVDYLRDNVFRPAAMQQTQPDDVHRIIPNRARGYRRTPAGGLENCALADTSNKIPGGGLVATAPDLVRFAVALQTGRLLKRETLERMFTRQRTRAGQLTNYGLGWYIREADGRKWVEHSGSQQGTATILMMLPGRGLAVAVLTNLERASARAIAARVAGVVLD